MTNTSALYLNQHDNGISAAMHKPSSLYVRIFVEKNRATENSSTLDAKILGNFLLLSITEHACAFHIPIYISLEMNTV